MSSPCFFRMQVGTVYSGYYPRVCFYLAAPPKDVFLMTYTRYKHHCFYVHRRFWRKLVFLVLLLLLADDVELNPGPPTKAEQMANMESMLMSLTASMNRVTTQLSSIQSKQEEFEKKLDTLIKSNDHLEKRVDGFEGLTKNLQAQIDALENRSRRCSLVFYGLDDTRSNETWEELKNHVLQLCNDKMGIDPIWIQSARRIGQYRANGKRPIIVNFVSWNEKESILHAGFKFKNSNYSVSEDFSKTLRDKKRMLSDFSKEIRLSKANKVFLSYDKLIVNGEAHIWDTEQKKAVLVHNDRHVRTQE
ncbi:uncharacterized protein LOC121836548 [Ixodes scapularis]|uniref:uncharacterized protein LOC121836548 n=1 Tax=Ixodes scapularis TaxID=6945 RepID=UPI001C38E5F9|nr:uncharacterized protein LOC121836548 [Ixodes scapularis]